MKTTAVSIKGMHCKSCELLIEDELMKIKGVQKVEVSHKTGEAVMHYSGETPSNGSVKRAVKSAGYELGKTENLPLVSAKTGDYADLGMSFVILVLLYLIGRELGLFNLSVQSGGNYSSLPIVFLVGLTAGVSSCMALVGGLVLGVASKFSQAHPDASVTKKFVPHLFFNLGRIASFFLLGGLVGVIGSVFQLSASMMGLLVIAVGAVMAVVGLQLTGIFPRLSNVSITLPKGISRTLGITEGEGEYSVRSSILLGALTFFVPCGFTQAMQLYAMSTGSFITGALTMAVFAIGTTPGLLGVGGLTSFMKGQYSKLFFKFAGLVVIALSVFNISNGLTLAGLRTTPKSTVQAAAVDPNVTVEDGKQVVHMVQTGQGYSPDTITVKKGVPVKWIVKSEDPNSCASSLVVPLLNIRTLLTANEQVFEFTPKETGDIRFTCSMGMYSGAFHVQ